jgi:ribosome biogenesis GTPase
VKGLVTATHRRHYVVLLDEGRTIVCLIRGRSLAIACGDRVAVSLSGDADGVIDTVEPRSSLLFRSDAHREKLLAANVTQVLGIVAPDPPYDDELVHRWIVAAESNHCRFALIANKKDLPSFASLKSRLSQFRALGYSVVATSATHDATNIMTLLDGQRSVMIGQSGMGKSTLINTLVAGARARVGEVSASLRSGRHTTTETTLYPLGAESWIVDSPGMKEFGLGHLSPAELEEAFVELRPLLGLSRLQTRCRAWVRVAGSDRGRSGQAVARGPAATIAGGYRAADP